MSYKCPVATRAKGRRMMQPTTVVLHSGFPVGLVDERIFGGFLEHMGRAVYEGVYDPPSRHADGNGLRSLITRMAAS